MGGAIGVRPEDHPHRHDAATQFLDKHALLFGHGAEVLADARIKREFVGSHSGMRTVVWQQYLDDIAVFQSVLIAHITRNDALVNISSMFVPNAAAATKLDLEARAALTQAPPVGAAQAVLAAAKSIGVALKPEEIVALGPIGNGRDAVREFTANSLVGRTQTRLVWLPMNRSTLKLCWRVDLANRTTMEAFLILMDAQTGEDLLRHALTVHASEFSYNVFTSDSPSPFSPGHDQPSSDQPPLTQRNLRTWSAFSPEASPLGWINEGDSETVGNNVMRDATQAAIIFITESSQVTRISDRLLSTASLTST